MASKKGKIKVKQNVYMRPTTQKSNVGNIGRKTLLSNAGNIKVRITKKA